MGDQKKSPLETNWRPLLRWTGDHLDNNWRQIRKLSVVSSNIGSNNFGLRKMAHIFLNLASSSLILNIEYKVYKKKSKGANLNKLTFSFMHSNEKVYLFKLAPFIIYQTLKNIHSLHVERLNFVKRWPLTIWRPIFKVFTKKVSILETKTKTKVSNDGDLSSYPCQSPHLPYFILTPFWWVKQNSWSTR